MEDRESEINPKVIPFKCVVCNGFGSLKHGALVCHGCDGKGYILVPNDSDNITKDRKKNENKDRLS